MSGDGMEKETLPIDETPGESDPRVSSEAEGPEEPSPGRLWRRKKRKRRWTIVAVLMIAFRIAGVFFAVDAVMSTRTAQGAIGWSIALVTLPVVSVPAYLVFGRSKFSGYVESRREHQEEIQGLMKEFMAVFPKAQVLAEDPRLFGIQSLLPRYMFTRQNQVDLLIDGDETFAAILEEMARAEDYLIVQFYIVHDDGIGRRMKEAMIERANAGVRVFFLYDEVGSSALPTAYKAELREAGVKVSEFGTRQGIGNRFQINFRNHRKIVVVDGRVGFVGGLNVGDEYLGLDPDFGFWRDTHMRVEGPSVIDMQRAFFADWYWATRELPDLNWEPVPAASGADVMTIGLPTGPADTFETAGLMFVELIQAARERLWIATPYFVPDRAVMAALQNAGLKGVDVRIIVPDKGDSLMVDLSIYSYTPDFRGSGVRGYRYEKGFMHQKVALIDDDISVIGTANFDNRSFRLNFEITQVIVDEDFATVMEAMFEEDFSNSRRFSHRDLEEKSFLFRLGARVARLAAPLQ